MNIVRIFKEHDIEIPFPQRDINFRKIMELKKKEDQRPLKAGEAEDKIELDS
jgi:small-conductance mechanosensitive channel